MFAVCNVDRIDIEGDKLLYNDKPLSLNNILDVYYFMCSPRDVIVEHGSLKDFYTAVYNFKTPEYKFGTRDDSLHCLKCGCKTPNCSLDHSKVGRNCQFVGYHKYIDTNDTIITSTVGDFCKHIAYMCGKTEKIYEDFLYYPMVYVGIDVTELTEELFTPHCPEFNIMDLINHPLLNFKHIKEKDVQYGVIDLSYGLHAWT